MSTPWKQIYWIGDIEYDEVRRVVGEMQSAFQEDDAFSIELILSSEGGHLDAAIAFYDLVHYVMKKTRQLNITIAGQADSAALVVMMAGHHRVSTPHSTFLFHELRRIGDGQVMNADQHIDTGNQLQRKMDRIVDILMSDIDFDSLGRTRDSVEQHIRKLCRNGEVLSAEEAEDLGIIDEILE